MTDWQATATATINEATWTLFEMSDGTWFATESGFTYFVPFTVSSTTSTTASMSTSANSQLSSAITASLQHARMVAIILGAVGGITLIAVIAYIILRARKFQRRRNWDGQLCIQVERAITSEPSPRSPALAKHSSLLRWVSKSSRADTMDLPIQAPPPCLLEPSKRSSRHKNTSYFRDSAYISFLLPRKHKAKAISPYLITEPSAIETEQKRMSLPIIQIQRAESFELPPYPPPTYAQSTVSHLDLTDSP